MAMALMTPAAVAAEGTKTTPSVLACVSMMATMRCKTAMMLRDAETVMSECLMAAKTVVAYAPVAP